MNEENIEDSTRNMRPTNGNTRDGVERRGGIQLVAQQVEQVVRKLHGMAWVGTSLKQSYGQP